MPVKNFEFIEVPGAPLPTVAKNYIKALFASINGKWQQQEKLYKRIFSGDLLFSVSLLKADQPIDERIKDLDKSVEFAIKGLSLEKRLKGYNLVNENIITLSF